jgi:dimethylamine/trimethylamine dehydrogenase
LAEATTELGGRVARESRLPGLSAWGRVVDYRVAQLHKLANIDAYFDSRMLADDLIQAEFDRIVLATGSTWRRDGVSRYHRSPIARLDDDHVLTPDDIMGGAIPAGPTVVYDDDHYYMGGVIAEKLRLGGFDVTLVTPAPLVSAWTVNTLEQSRIQARLLEAGVTVCANEAVTDFTRGEVGLACVFTGRRRTLPATSVVMVTARNARSELQIELSERKDEISAAGIKSVTAIGDALAPGTIASAVFSGHRYAREFEQEANDDVPFLREIAELGTQ